MAPAEQIPPPARKLLRTKQPARFAQLYFRQRQSNLKAACMVTRAGALMPVEPPFVVHRLAIVGRGRLGRALHRALSEAGAAVAGPLARDEAVGDADLVLLCVPERELRAAAAAVGAGPIVGHCSGSAPLDELRPHERFVMHPLMTVTQEGAAFAGAACAIDASSTRALDAARHIAQLLGMQPVRIPAERRALYHAAASMASNFLVTLEASAERLAATCGIDHAALVPLVRAAAENWARVGAAEALTGPIARGDEHTASQQRQAVAEAAPDLLPLWDALADATRDLAGATDVP